MKNKITMLSPHQNAKVVGVIMGIMATIFAIPVIIFSMLPHIMNPSESDIPISFLPFILIPIIYLVIGYLATLISCSLYNTLYKYIGGFEFEMAEKENENEPKEEVLIHIPEEKK